MKMWRYWDGQEAETKRDMLREVAMTLKAAEQGDADAQNYLGWMYSHGSGVCKNKVEAVKWYRKVAEQGDSDAKRALEELEAK